MRRDVRDRFASGTNQADLTTGNACWETPPQVVDKLAADLFPFDVDICADVTRAVRPVWFGPGSLFSTDALAGGWLEWGTAGFCNPPYGRFVQRILPVAKVEAAAGFPSVFLIPLRVTKAFRLHVLSGASDLLFCDKRICFWRDGTLPLNPKTGAPDTSMFDSIIVVYRPGVWARPRLGEWAVPPHTDVDYRRSESGERATAGRTSGAPALDFEAGGPLGNFESGGVSAFAESDF